MTLGGCGACRKEYQYVNGCLAAMSAQVPGLSAYVFLYVPISQSPDRFAVWPKMSGFGVFSNDELFALRAYGYRFRDIQHLQRQVVELQLHIPSRVRLFYSPELLVLHTCNYCRYGLHRAGPIAPRHSLPHVWDRSRPCLVTFRQHLRMLRESFFAGRPWWDQGLSNYYCEACHTWWKKYWSALWDHWVLFCISIAQHAQSAPQPLHSECLQHWSYILILVRSLQGVYTKL